MKLRKMRDFTGEKAVAVVCELMGPAGELATKMDRAALQKAGNNLGVMGTLFGADPAAMLEIFRILAAEPFDARKLTAADTAEVMFQLATDGDFFKLFGLQSETPASSGSVSETTEAQGE